MNTAPSFPLRVRGKTDEGTDDYVTRQITRQSLSLAVPAASRAGGRCCSWVPGRRPFFCPGSWVCVPADGEKGPELMEWKRGWEMLSGGRHSTSKGVELGLLFI